MLETHNKLMTDIITVAVGFLVALKLEKKLSRSDIVKVLNVIAFRSLRNSSNVRGNRSAAKSVKWEHSQIR